jgi:hypothetical protein
MTDLGDGPIEDEYREAMRSIAVVLDSAFNGDDRNKIREVGFVVMVFPLNQVEGEHRCNYISNAKRDDVIVLLKEQLRRFEGQPEARGTA